MRWMAPQLEEPDVDTLEGGTHHTSADTTVTASTGDSIQPPARLKSCLRASAAISYRAIARQARPPAAAQPTTKGRTRLTAACPRSLDLAAPTAAARPADRAPQPRRSRTSRGDRLTRPWASLAARRGHPAPPRALPARDPSDLETSRTRVTPSSRSWPRARRVHRRLLAAPTGVSTPLLGRATPQCPNRARGEK